MMAQQLRAYSDLRPELGFQHLGWMGGSQAPVNTAPGHASGLLEDLNIHGILR